METLELVSDGVEEEPDTIEGVTILKQHYYIRRVGIEGYLVEIPRALRHSLIEKLDEIGYDVYVHRE